MEGVNNDSSTNFILCLIKYLISIFTYDEFIRFLIYHDIKDKTKKKLLKDKFVEEYNIILYKDNLFKYLVELKINLKDYYTMMDIEYISLLYNINNVSDEIYKEYLTNFLKKHLDENDINLIISRIDELELISKKESGFKLSLEVNLEKRLESLVRLFHLLVTGDFKVVYSTFVNTKLSGIQLHINSYMNNPINNNKYSKVKYQYLKEQLLVK